MNVSLEDRAPVFVVRLHEEGRVQRDFLSEMNAALDAVEKQAGHVCCVLTGEGDRFSTGFDLEALKTQAGEIVPEAIRLLGRLLSFAVPVAAGVNGHAFGIGAMIALACDFQVMRADRGYWCLPGIDLGMPLAPAMTALLQQKLEPRSLAEVLLTGRRIGGSEAAALGIVDEACAADAVVDACVARVGPLADKHPATYAALKRGLYRRTLEVIEAEHGPS